MSYTVYYEIAGRRRITTYAEPATANMRLAMTGMARHRAAGLPSWIRCGNGQILTAGW
jgi:hypothetical protein